MIHTSSKTSEEFAQDYDRHGDCYYDDTTEDELRNVFHKIQDDVMCHLFIHLLSLISNNEKKS